MMKSVVFGLVLALAFAGAAEARKKPFSVAGCTAAILQKVVQSPAGAECARKQDDAFLNGGDPIVFVCSPDGSVSCCSAGPRPSCSSISRTANNSVLDSLGGGTLEMSQ